MSFRENFMSGNWVSKAVFVISAVILLNLIAPYKIVPPGYRGVKTTLGKVSDGVLAEGFHFIVPFVQQVILMDVRIQKEEAKGQAASKDLQTIHTAIALNYHIEPSKVTEVYRELGQAVGDRIVVPAIQESVKAATALYTAEELISKRSEVKDNITEILSSRLKKFGIVVDEFSITNFDFSKSFNEAIEAKTTAEQLKLKAERDLQRIKVEAEQKIANAKAEAESLRLQKQEVTEQLLKLREVENQKLAIEKWDGKLPQVSGDATPFINLAPSVAPTKK